MSALSSNKLKRMTYIHVPVMTFIDVKNAFGSISPIVIRDVLSALRLPLEIELYESNVYSQLRGFLNTKHWSSPQIIISRGVFFLSKFPLNRFLKPIIPDPQVPIYS